MSVQSPCVQECRLDPLGESCVGCGRTLQEITDWLRMGDAARLAVMADLPRRRLVLLQAEFAAEATRRSQQESASF